MEKEPNEAIGGLNDLYEFERLMRTKQWMVVSGRAIKIIGESLVLKEEDSKVLAYFETRVYSTHPSSPLKLLENITRVIHVVRKTEELYDFINHLLKGGLAKEAYSNMVFLDLDPDSKKVKAFFARDEKELDYLIEVIENVVSEP
jgi:hypothetical protein